jgi:hypothetical protein
MGDMEMTCRKDEVTRGDLKRRSRLKECWGGPINSEVIFCAAGVDSLRRDDSDFGRATPGGELTKLTR